MRRISLILLGLIYCCNTYAQSGVIRGRVYNKLNNQPLPFAPVGIPTAGIGVTSDSTGHYQINKLVPGVYRTQVNLLGYKPLVVFDVQVSGTRITELDLGLEEQLEKLNEVEVKPDAFVKREESPVSAYSIGEVEIKRNPGSNRDASKALQSLPGVAATASFRNDLIIRGGSTNENRFYLDGIEVPNINHFSTQGATGGPVGMINVDFIRDVDFYSGSFPAQRGNMLSSLLDFKLKDGRDDRKGYTLTLGATDLAATVDGPIGKNVTFIGSWRRSYLQFLFQSLGLPFLPRYDDLLLKTRWKINAKNEITFLGLGAYDVVTLNKKDSTTDFQKYVLGYLPENNQWNYTIGASYKHYRPKSYITMVLSRNALQNEALKYRNNDNTVESGKLLDYTSRETENKFRFEQTGRAGAYKITYGANLEQAIYSTSTFNKLPQGITLQYADSLTIYKYGLFGQVSGQFLKEKLTASLGFRMDGTDYNKDMSRLWQQFAPRVSLSYAFANHFRFNASAGSYSQLPTYTLLGYKDNAGNLVNKNSAKYIRCDHLVAGLEYTNSKLLRITVEGFYKRYTDYPFNLRDSISIANQGNDFGVIGNAPVRYDNKGRSYGMELMIQKKLSKHFYGIIAYTYLHSQFQNASGDYISSSWDYRQTLSLTGGYYFKKNWELGMRFRYNSGQPYTPYNESASLLASNWDISGLGIPDRSQINSLRTAAFQQLDVRLDKKFFFSKWSLNLYLDIQNLLNYKTQQQPYLSVERDALGMPVVNPANPGSYLPNYIQNKSGSLIPTIGFVLEF